MKKLLVLLMMMTAIPANAAFVADTPQTTTPVASVLKMKNDSFVSVQGKIIKQIGDEKYLFTDGKTQIVVEIDDELLLNITVTPKNTVLLTGEVDKDFNSIKIDASSIKIIK